MRKTVNGQVQQTANEAILSRIHADKTPVAEAVEQDTSMRAKLHAQIDELFHPNAIKCSFKRTLVAFAAGLAASCAIGAVGGTLVGLMMVGASVLAVPNFLIITLWVIGAIINFWLSTLGFNACYQAVIDKSADAAVKHAKEVVSETFGRVTSTVSGWFKADAKVAA